MTQEKQTALAFVEAINRHDVAQILSLMTEDHFFIDAHGNQETKEDMTQGWPGYFAWFPDYHIEVLDVLEDGNTVGIFGLASGTYSQGAQNAKDRRFHIPAAWKVLVHNGKVKLWQVFADSKIPYDIMDKANESP